LAARRTPASDSDRQREGGDGSGHGLEVLAVDNGKHRFEARIGTGSIGPGGDAPLRTLADIPILLVGFMPELNRRGGIKARLRDRIRMVEPLTGDDASMGTAPGESMDEDEVRLQADQHIREDHVIVGSLQVFSLEAGQVVRAALSRGCHSTAGPADLHRAAEKRSFFEVVRRRPEVAEFVEGRVYGGTVIAFGIILNDQLPIRGDVVFHLVSDFQVADSPGSESFFQWSEVGIEVVRIFRKIDEDRAHRCSAGDVFERIVLFLKLLGFIHIRGADKLAVEGVGPRMVGAGDVFTEFPLVR